MEPEQNGEVGPEPEDDDKDEAPKRDRVTGALAAVEEKFRAADNVAQVKEAGAELAALLRELVAG